MAAKQLSTFRLDQQTLDRLDALSEGLAIPRPEVLRRSIAAFRSLAVAAEDATAATIAELKARFGDDAEITVTIEEVNRREMVRLRVDGEEPDAVQVWPIIPPTLDHVLVLVVVGEADRIGLEARLALGQLTGIVPGLCVGRLAWPPQADDEIVLRVGDLAPQLPAAVAARLAEAVGV